MRGLRVVELGCGLGVPSLVAAAKGARRDRDRLAPDAIELLRQNAARNGLDVRAEVRDWREPWKERFDLAVAADVLYEQRNVEPVLARLRELAPVALVGLAGRPYEQESRLAARQELAPRVVRLDPAKPNRSQGQSPGHVRAATYASPSSTSASSPGCVKNGEWPVSSSTMRAPAARALPTCHAGSIAASSIVATTMSRSQRVSATGWSSDWRRSCANAASDCSRVQSGYMCAAHVSPSGQ